MGNVPLVGLAYTSAHALTLSRLCERTALPADRVGHVFAAAIRSLQVGQKQHPTQAMLDQAATLAANLLRNEEPFAKHPKRRAQSGRLLVDLAARKSI